MRLKTPKLYRHGDTLTDPLELPNVIDTHRKIDIINFPGCFPQGRGRSSQGSIEYHC
jgi:hypothetical protein